MDVLSGSLLCVFFHESGRNRIGLDYKVVPYGLPLADGESLFAILDFAFF